MKLTNILVTGSSGFVGRHLVKKLSEIGVSFNSLDRARFLATHEIPTEKCEIVIHLAGRAHVLREKSADPYKEFYTANCKFAIDVAKAASTKGLKRFVYVSSIGVFGKSCSINALTEASGVEPKEHYSTSKLEAEGELTLLSRELGFELVIVRPALVYGYDSPGNINRLLALVEKLPVIPIAEKTNKRALVYVENLVDFLLLTTNHPRAAGKAFNIADDSISTHEILSGFAKGMKKKPILFAGPRIIWKLIFFLTGKTKMYEQLFESLVIDMSYAQKELGWQPKFETGIALENTGQMFIKGKYS
ncbi:NAD-dependent epimerase/dehydratase family protein [Pseudidiomarina andamanensis]|uniref:NAD-dependent epimerase/dehydratase family protein n=1 Tax=Pseudidiomarina andamanensis TaxID=1940690 RepID=UPI001566C186|nr:NAD-dependent epimerase/dehydratase family protein [Pseudidiomarina andamanensis]MDS0217768.1 NAD-dependent epimerase/dehydratase family protein [Pseudidiomarina andamanensis]